MNRFRIIPLESILKKPDNPMAYLRLNNQYWALDRNGNVFFSGNRPICAPTKREVNLYIRRLNVSMAYTLINLQTAWVKQPLGYSLGNGDWKV